MNWYLLRLVFQLKGAFGEFIQRLDLQLRLLEAENAVHAFKKVRQQGAQAEKDEVWIERLLFTGVPDLVRLVTPGNGMNRYSFTMETADPEEYLTFIRGNGAFTGMHP